LGRTQHRARPVGTYFITIDSWAGRQLFKAEVAKILTDQLMQCRAKGYFLLHEFCVMPNHLHALLTPAGSSTLEKTVQMIKGGASYRINKQRKFLAFWQDGYHDWRCRSEQDYQKYAAYIRENPVKAGLVQSPEEWPYSSANPKFAEFLDPIPQGLKAQGGDRAAMSTLKG
jgi:putative transposase